MKTILFCIVLIGLTLCASAQISTNQPSRFKAKVICYEGNIRSAESGHSEIFGPTEPGTTAGVAIETPGREFEWNWKFVGRKGGKDVYTFTFTHTANASSSVKKTMSKEVQFDGKKIIIFEEKFYTVVMESPSEEELKAAKTY